MAARFSQNEVVAATGAVCLQTGTHDFFEGVCTDTRQLTPGCLFVALLGERFDGHTFLVEAAKKGAKGALVQKGRAFEKPANLALFEVEDTLVGLGHLARFHRRRFDIPIGAITGSNGKTTTKEMVAAILSTRGDALATQGNLNNEIGVPLTLFRLEASHRSAVIEMGMNHKGEIARLTAMAEPQAGLITCIQPAHLKGLGTLEGVASAKGELFAHLPGTGVAVVNADDPLVVGQASKVPARKLSYGRHKKADVRLENVRSNGDSGLSLRIFCDKKSWDVSLSFIGEHNAMNATGAFALAKALGFSSEECVLGLGRARPYQRRLNVLKAPLGFTVLDDCYNANPASMAAALDTLRTLAGQRRAVAVLGDMLELGEGEERAHHELGEKAARSAQLVAFFGPLSAMAQRAGGGGDDSAHFTEIEPLLSWLRPRLSPNDIILVKGSRGMRLERVVEALTERSSPPSGGH